MHKGRLIGGLFCLAVAALLAVLSVVLPEGKVYFMIDGTNMPMVPVLVLAGVGVWLLATVRKRKSAP